MALSEDAIAIVASNLTAAHCSASPSFTNEVPIEDIARQIAGIYESYLKHVRADTLDHIRNTAPPS